MTSASTPYQGVLEGVFQCAVNRVTHVLDSRVPANDHSFAEVGINSLSVAELEIDILGISEKRAGNLPLRV
jgi:hypothetical protein